MVLHASRVRTNRKEDERLRRNNVEQHDGTQNDNNSDSTNSDEGDNSISIRQITKTLIIALA